MPLMACGQHETPVDFAAFRPKHCLWSLDGKAAMPSRRSCRRSKETEA
jgi:hypothetical protein